MSQLSLFDQDVFGNTEAILNDNPHPLIVAARWGFKLSYVDQDGDKDHYLYAGIEWFRGLGGDRSRWTRVKSKLLLSTQQLPFTAADGKTYQIDFVTQDDLYRIAMDMRQTAKRPQLKEIVAYLAKAGVLFDQFRRKPQKAIRTFEEIEDRKALCAAEKHSHAAHAPNYGMLTNQTYQVLFGAAKSELCKHLGLNYTQSRNFRDQLSELARRAIQMSEAGAAAQMSAESGLSDMQQADIVRWYAAKLAPIAVEMAQQAGIDLLSGKRMIEA